MVSQGDAFYRSGHPWIVLTDPNHVSGKVLCVNLTTFDDECSDDECVLNEQDYIWIEVGHPTAVAFSRAIIIDVAKLDEWLINGNLTRVNPAQVPAQTVTKIIDIARNSRELSDEKKELL